MAIGRTSLTSLIAVLIVQPFAAVAATQERAASSGPPGEIAAELQSFVDGLAEADQFSGTVLLAREDEVLFEGAWGLASKRFDVPNRVDTKFNLGSMNKMFTAVAVAQLVEVGELSFEDPISRYLDDDWLPLVDKEKVHVEHLLCHTSGLGSYFNERYMRSSRELFREVDDYKPLVAGETLGFEPGTQSRYSNTGMLVLGAVIEGATGQSYFEFVRENVYEPAGMTDTDCYDMDRPVPNLAMGYSRESDGSWTNNLYKHVIRGGPAGGGFSTVQDLQRFAVALCSGELLGPDLTDALWSPKPELGSPDYGFGFGIYGRPGDRIVGHSGGFPGISSNLDIFLDSGFTAVVMSNYDGGSQPVMEKMRQLVRRTTRR